MTTVIITGYELEKEKGKQGLYSDVIIGSYKRQKFRQFFTLFNINTENVVAKIQKIKNSLCVIFFKVLKEVCKCLSQWTNISDCMNKFLSHATSKHPAKASLILVQGLFNIVSCAVSLSCWERAVMSGHKKVSNNYKSAGSSFLFIASRCVI